MHRVRINKRRVIALRIIAYTATLTLSIITTALLIYAAMGYRITRSGNVVRSGLILVDSAPIKADIYLNGQSRSNAPGRFVLPAGSYKLELAKDGYRTWQNHITITGSQVERVRYPILLPTTLSPAKQMDLSSDAMHPSLSLDRKKLLFQANNSPVLTLVTLGTKESNVRQINLTDQLGDQTSSLRVLGWSPNNKRVILSYSRAKEKKLLLVDLESSSQRKVVPDSFAIDQDLPILFKGNDHFYAVNQKNELRYYQFDLEGSQLMLSRVKSYSATSSGGHEIAFVRDSSDQKTLELGASNGNETVVIDKSPSSANILNLASAVHDGNWYVVASDFNGRLVRLYRNPLDKPILDSQLPFATIQFAAKQIKVSPYGQRFILLQNGGNLYTYDIETLRGKKIQLKDASSSSLSWMTDFQMSYKDTKSSMTYMVDYDGANKQPLLDDDMIIMSSDKKSLYSLQDRSLRVTNLIVE